MSSDTHSLQTKTKSSLKLGLPLVLLLSVSILYFTLRESLSLAQLAAYEAILRDWFATNPWLVYSLAFLAYVVVAGLSIPSGPSLLTIGFGWFFGAIPGIVLVSLGSTIGACIAFLLSRFLFQSTVEARFGERLSRFNEALVRDGPFYLFLLRLVPVVPYIVVNLVMGLTSLRLRTFWWISLIGMFPATVVYVYAGSCVPTLTDLNNHGLSAVFSPQQLTQLTLAFAMLGTFPLLVRMLVKAVKKDA